MAAHGLPGPGAGPEEEGLRMFLTVLAAVLNAVVCNHLVPTSTIGSRCYYYCLQDK